MSLEVSALRAIAHPTRLQILSLLTGAAMSASELARELGISQANASYHLRTLAAAGEVVEAGQERIRGGVAKRYRHPWDEPPPTRSTSPADHRAHLQAMASELVRRGASRQQGSRSLYTDAELWVDRAVWEQAMASVQSAAVLLHGQARTPHSAGTVRVAMSAALFEMTDSGAAEERR